MQGLELDGFTGEKDPCVPLVEMQRDIGGHDGKQFFVADAEGVFPLAVQRDDPPREVAGGDRNDEHRPDVGIVRHVVRIDGDVADTFDPPFAKRAADNPEPFTEEILLRIRF